MYHTVEFKFAPSSEPQVEDDEYKVLITTSEPCKAILDGEEVVFSIQVSGGEYFPNAYSASEVPEDFWMKELTGDKGFRRLQDAQGFILEYIRKNVQVIAA